ncbi:MAG: hypothetical protein AAGB51_03370 [Planctomycetota bacterium]
MLKAQHALLALALTLAPASVATAAGPVFGQPPVTETKRGPVVGKQIDNTHHRRHRGQRHDRRVRYEYTTVRGRNYWRAQRRAHRIAHREGWNVLGRPRAVWDAYDCVWRYEVNLRRPIVIERRRGRDYDDNRDSDRRERRRDRRRGRG